MQAPDAEPDSEPDPRGAAMTVAATDPPPAPPRPSKLPLVLGLLLAVGGGAGGFLGVRMLGGESATADGGAVEAETGHDADGALLPALAPAAFVPLPPLVVNLPERRLLRFAAQVEVAPEHLDEVTALVPRIVDVLNGYLRAVEPAEVEDPAALVRLRAQMLRRVQVVAGGDRARDLLVMEFVVN